MDLPKIGFGTWQLEEGRETRKAVIAAIEAGYRLIDTAKIYGNEKSVGEAIKSSGLPREELIVTTKLWQSDMGYESAHSAFNESLHRLGLDYLDIYLIHWPGSGLEARRSSWRALEELKSSGKVKQIGVSNYGIEHLDEMAGYSKDKPFINQIEFHPFVFNKQKAVLEYCRKENIVVEAYSPLAQASKLNDPLLEEIAKSHNCSPAQILLAWAIAQGTVPIPRSSNSGRIKQNIEIDQIKLTQDEVESLCSLSNGRSVLG